LGLAYTVYVFPRRRTFNQLLVRLKTLGVSFKTYPDDISKGWVKRKWKGRNHMKTVYCVIIPNAEPSLAYELRAFGRVRFEAQALTPTLAAGMLTLLLQAQPDLGRPR